MVWQDRIPTLDHKSELFFTHQIYTDHHVLMSLLTVRILCKTTNPLEIQIFYFVPLSYTYRFFTNPYLSSSMYKK